MPVRLPGSLYFAPDSRVRGGGTAFHHPQGPGRRRSQVCLGTLDDLPALTPTARWAFAEAEPNAPRARHLRTIATGPAEEHGWSARRTAVRPTTRPGAADHRTVESLSSAPAPPTGGSASATGSGRSCHDHPSSSGVYRPIR